MDTKAYCQDVLKELRGPGTRAYARTRFPGADRLQMVVLVASLAQFARPADKFEATLVSTARRAGNSGQRNLATAAQALLDDWHHVARAGRLTHQRDEGALARGGLSASTPSH